MHRSISGRVFPKQASLDLIGSSRRPTVSSDYSHTPRTTFLLSRPSSKATTSFDDPILDQSATKLKSTVHLLRLSRHRTLGLLASICTLGCFGGSMMAGMSLTQRQAEARLLTKVLWDFERNDTTLDTVKRKYESSVLKLGAYRQFKRSPQQKLQRLRRAVRVSERRSRAPINTMLMVFIAASWLACCGCIFAALTAREKQDMAAKSRRHLIKGMNVPTLVVQADNRDIVDANRAALDVFEYDKHELMGKSIDDLLPGLFEDELAQEEDASNCSVSTQKPSQRRRIIGHTGFGSKRIMVCDVTRTLYENGKVYDTVVAQDITELMQKADDLEAQKKVLSQFTHEMRNKYTPATHMLEHVQTLIEQEGSNLRRELRGSLHDIRLSVGLLHEADQLVATRLQLHKIYSGSYVSEPNVETFDLIECMQHRVETAAALGHRDVAFKVEVWVESYDTSDLHARLDMYIWTHLANNLLSNARKHTSHGSVIFALANEDDGRLIFAVRDTGMGMPASVASRLFREEVASGDVRGVGLGLVSCAKFAQSIGGDCWLEYTKPTTPQSPKDGGSEFRFSLPGKIVRTHRIRNTLPTDTDVAASAVPATLAVIVVEDSQLIRKSIITKLKTARRRLLATPHDRTPDDWTFVEHATVESFLPHVDEFAAKPDCLITVDQNLDSQGGHATGSDLIKKLRAANFKGVIVSISGDDNVALEHKQLGAHISWGQYLCHVAEFCVCRTYMGSYDAISSSCRQAASKCRRHLSDSAGRI